MQFQTYYCNISLTYAYASVYSLHQNIKVFMKILCSFILISSTDIHRYKSYGSYVTEDFDNKHAAFQRKRFSFLIFVQSIEFDIKL